MNNFNLNPNVLIEDMVDERAYSAIRYVSDNKETIQELALLLHNLEKDVPELLKVKGELVSVGDNIQAITAIVPALPSMQLAAQLAEKHPDVDWSKLSREWSKVSTAADVAEAVNSVVENLPTIVALEAKIDTVQDAREVASAFEKFLPYTRTLEFWEENLQTLQDAKEAEGHWKVLSENMPALQVYAETLPLAMLLANQMAGIKELAPEAAHIATLAPHARYLESVSGVASKMGTLVELEEGIVWLYDNQDAIALLATNIDVLIYLARHMHILVRYENIADEMQQLIDLLQGADMEEWIDLIDLSNETVQKLEEAISNASALLDEFGELLPIAPYDEPSMDSVGTLSEWSDTRHTFKYPSPVAGILNGVATYSLSSTVGDGLDLTGIGSLLDPSNPKILLSRVQTDLTPIRPLYNLADHHEMQAGRYSVGSHWVHHLEYINPKLYAYTLENRWEKPVYEDSFTYVYDPLTLRDGDSIVCPSGAAPLLRSLDCEGLAGLVWADSTLVIGEDSANRFSFRNLRVTFSTNITDITIYNTDVLENVHFLFNDLAQFSEVNIRFINSPMSGVDRLLGKYKIHISGAANVSLWFEGIEAELAGTSSTITKVFLKGSTVTNKLLEQSTLESPVKRVSGYGSTAYTYFEEGTIQDKENTGFEGFSLSVEEAVGRLSQVYLTPAFTYQSTTLQDASNTALGEVIPSWVRVHGPLNVDVQVTYPLPYRVESFIASYNSVISPIRNKITVHGSVMKQFRTDHVYKDFLQGFICKVHGNTDMGITGCRFKGFIGLWEVDQDADFTKYVSVSDLSKNPAISAHSLEIGYSLDEVGSPVYPSDPSQASVRMLGDTAYNNGILYSLQGSILSNIATSKWFSLSAAIIFLDLDTVHLRYPVASLPPIQGTLTGVAPVPNTHPLYAESHAIGVPSSIARWKVRTVLVENAASPLIPAPETPVVEFIESRAVDNFTLAPFAVTPIVSFINSEAGGVRGFATMTPVLSYTGSDLDPANFAAPRIGVFLQIQDIHNVPSGADRVYVELYKGAEEAAKSTVSTQPNSMPQVSF